MATLNTADIRSLNKQRIVDFILKNPGISQAQLQKRIGLCSQTVNKVLKILEEEQIIARGEVLQSTGGRPPIALRIKADAKYAIGADVSDNTIMICVVDLQGDVVALRTEQIGQQWMPDGNNMASAELLTAYVASTVTTFEENVFTSLLPKAVQALLDELSIARERILGLCLTVPGWIEKDVWRVGALKIDIGRIRAANEEALGIPFSVIRKEEAIGLSESRLLEQPNMLSLFLDGGVGGLLVANGASDAGTFGHSWSVGHILLHPYGRPCPCGRSGCFGAYCSSFTLLTEKYPTYEAFFGAVESRAFDASSLFFAYLKDLALGLCTLAALVDRPIVLSGAMADWLEPYLPQLEQEVAQVNGSDFRVQFSLGRLRKNAAAVAAALRQQQEYLAKLV